MIENTKATILSVDDEANILKSLGRTLRKLDINLLTANSGDEAIKLMEDNEVDVILSDMRMPGMSGAEFLARAKVLQPNSQRILLTGYSDMESAVTAINNGGICNYLTKPWDDNKLREVVADAIRIARLERENITLSKENISQNQKLKELNDSLEEKVTSRTQELKTANDMLGRTVSQLESSYDTMVVLLANLAAMPNPESESTRKKIDLALSMGEELALDARALVDLHRATRLHRLGWAALPAGLTDKSLQDMSALELSKFQQHPLLAEALLLDVTELTGVAKILRCQHEKYEGDGFPDRLAKDNIPKAAQILAIARDYYDAVNGRLRKNVLSGKDARDQIINAAGKRYNPAIVAAFKKVLPTIENVQLQVFESQVEAHMLRDGMVLTRDLTTEHGALLLNKGHVLTESVIATIVNLVHHSDNTLAIYVKRPSDD